MLTGAGLGLLLNWLSPIHLVNELVVDGLFAVVGQMFIRSLTMMVVPLVFVSLVAGTCSLKDVTQLGRIGLRTVALYFLTTAIAITLALSLALLLRPGRGFDLPTEAQFTPAEAFPLSEVLVNIVPANPVQSMAEGNMLQVIVFAVFLGLAISLVGEPAQRVEQGFRDLNRVLMQMVLILVRVAPYGVFCLMARVFATQGFEALLPLLQYFLLVLFVLALHMFLVYPFLLRVFTGLNGRRFFANIQAAPLFAFSTASSNATIPITLETVENKLGVHNSIASFTIPLGATINMDGTAILQGCATVFISQAYNLPIGVAGYGLVVLTATLASIGTAGVPGMATIMLAMVLQQAGLPVEGIGLILGVDRLLDMCRTAVNITGDAVVTCILAQREGALNEAVFYGSTDG